MRVSCTTLESFRLFMQPDQDWMSEHELIDSIKGVWTPTPKVELGSAFGKVLETPEPFKIAGGYRCGEYAFGDDVMAPCLALMDRRGVFEAKAVKRYGECDVVAKADQLLGARLIEHKTTLSTFDFDKYAASYQWRFMVDIFEPVSVTYHVFCLYESPTGVIELRSIETFNFYPYAELHQDCCDLLGKFTDYVTAKGLDALLRGRQKDAA